jgi:hypothetical protein
MSRQLSLFGAQVHPPNVLDLEGLLAGAGQVVRLGDTARVSIVVNDRWRVSALLGECACRGVAASSEPSTVDNHYVVRTAFTAALAPLSAAWLRGAVKVPPAGFTLDGGRLRLWTAASGGPDGEAGYTLRVGPGDERAWGLIGAALAAAGLPAILLGPRAGGPAYRIVGRRRLRWLSELVAEPPSAAPPGAWPS